jgi:hypothetical protein
MRGAVYGEFNRTGKGMVVAYFRALLILYYRNLEEAMLSNSKDVILHEVLCVRPCQSPPLNHSELTTLTLNRSAKYYFGSTRWNFRLEHVACVEWMCPLLEICSSHYHTNASTDCQHVSTIRSRTSARCGCRQLQGTACWQRPFIVKMTLEITRMQLPEHMQYTVNFHKF